MPNRNPDFVYALNWANEKHWYQTRKGTDIPYFSHLMMVAALVMEVGGSKDEVIAALLHDVIEDCDDVEKEDVAARFGDRVAAIVEGLSDASAKAGEEKQSWKSRKDAYLAHLQNSDDTSILLVSNADKLHNARCILRDLEDPEVGAKLWDRFSSSADENLWYYETLVEIFTRKSPSEILAKELAEVVTKIKHLVCL